MSDQCRCVTCDCCHGSGTVRVRDDSQPEGWDLDQCDECHGGISEECDYCRNQRDLDEDNL